MKASRVTRAVEYEDKVSIPTPEGVELELPLAGIGSRLAARIIDHLIQGAVALVGILVYAGAVDSSSLGEALTAIIGILMGFAIFWAYDVVFEAFGGGRTPGKRALGLRVLGDRGEPIGFAAASVRNVMRLIDEYLTLWIVALISMVRSERNQRLGDVAAAAIVVRERTESTPAEAAIGIGTLGEIASASSWDTTAVSDAELAAARRFLERRYAVDAQARTRLARELYARLRPKVRGADTSSPEQFIELLVAVKSRRG